MKNKRKFIGPAIFVAILGLGIAVTWYYTNGDSIGTIQPAESSVLASTQPTQVSPAVVLTLENARTLEGALNSGVKSEQAMALVPELRSGEWSSESVVPAGTVIAIDHSTFVVADDQTATVQAMASGTHQADFVFHLILVDDRWLIFATENVA